MAVASRLHVRFLNLSYFQLLLYKPPVLSSIFPFNSVNSSPSFPQLHFQFASITSVHPKPASSLSPQKQREHPHLFISQQGNQMLHAITSYTLLSPLDPNPPLTSTTPPHTLSLAGIPRSHPSLSLLAEDRRLCYHKLSITPRPPISAQCPTDEQVSPQPWRVRRLNRRGTEVRGGVMRPLMGPSQRREEGRGKREGWKIWVRCDERFTNGCRFDPGWMSRYGPPEKASAKKRRR